MQIELTSKSVRDMAARVVKTHPDMTKPKVLEVLAHAFGHRNFDTLSGLLKTEALQPLDPAKPDTLPEISALKFPVTLWLECQVMADRYGPRWARLVLTQTFLETVLELQARCRQWNSRVITEEGRPDEWDEYAGHNRYFNMRDSQLCVSQERFWFQAHPKHCTYYVETRAVYISDLLDLLKAGSGGQEDFCWAGGELYRDSGSVLDLFDTLPGNANIDWDAVAEWVGLHYQVNFDAETPVRRLEWVTRYRDSHTE